MSCSCKKKQIPINNLKNQEILNIANEINDTIITQKSFAELNDFDWLELYQVWSMLYPQASNKPSKEQCISDIQNSLQFLRVKYGKRRR
jgi:hypothetical protein